MNKIFYIPLLFVFLSGCAIENIAMKEDVQEMRSNVGEQLHNVKTQSDQVKWQVDEANKRAIALEKELDSIKGQIVENNKIIDKKLTELKRSIEDVDRNRLHSEEETEKKIQIVLDEVTKENQKLLSKIEKKTALPKTKKENTKSKNPKPKNQISSKP